MFVRQAEDNLICVLGLGSVAYPIHQNDCKTEVINQPLYFIQLRDKIFCENPVRNVWRWSVEMTSHNNALIFILGSEHCEKVLMKCNIFPENHLDHQIICSNCSRV